MNNKAAIISIYGSEKFFDDGEDGTTELVTEGKYYKKGDKYYLSYTETEVTGFDERTVTTLKIDGDSVAMTRFGQINTHMVFRRGEKHTGHYETPYGSFTVGVVSDDVKVNIGDCGGDIELRYLLEIDNNTKAQHALKMHIEA